MKATFNFKAEKVKILQDMVKHYNMRFHVSPYDIGNGQMRVTIDGDHLPMSVCNEFFAAWDHVNTDIKEVYNKKSFFTKVKNHVKSDFKTLIYNLKKVA